MLKKVHRDCRNRTTRGMSREVLSRRFSGDSLRNVNVYRNGTRKLVDLGPH
jgi:hypothetical protein